MNKNVLFLAKNLINRQKEIQEKGVKIIKQGEYTKFYYDLLQSPDFSDPEVTLCRGITFRGDKIVCCPFFKFGNYGESYAPEIDWASARVLEKLDGSLITLWYDYNKWNISTSKTVDAFECSPSLGSYTFGGLFTKAAVAAHLDLEQLNKNYTYMFELTSPYNKIVIPYSETKIWHIGTRNNETLEEVEIDIGIQKPAEYRLSSLEGCIAAAAAFEKEKEGFVVVDKNYNRIKVKSPDYFRLHRMANNGVISKTDIVQLLLAGDEKEYLSYFPEKQIVFDFYQNKLNNLITELDYEWGEVKQKIENSISQKEKAKIISKMIVPDFGFKNLKQEKTAKEYLNDCQINRVLKLIGE